MRVSHETIYQSIYVYPRGDLLKQLKTSLLRGRDTRRPRGCRHAGTNENTNGLRREYLPKGTDLSQHTPAQLQAIQDDLNDRPRKRLGYRTPREEFDRLLVEDHTVATTA